MVVLPVQSTTSFMTFNSFLTLKFQTFVSFSKVKQRFTINLKLNISFLCRNLFNNENAPLLTEMKL